MSVIQQDSLDFIPQLAVNSSNELRAKGKYILLTFYSFQRFPVRIDLIVIDVLNGYISLLAILYNNIQSQIPFYKHKNKLQFIKFTVVTKSNLWSEVVKQDNKIGL